MSPPNSETSPPSSVEIVAARPPVMAANFSESVSTA
jgi:hypothetical protein